MPRKPIPLVAGATVVLVAAIIVWNWWSQPPAVGFDNLKYLQLLRTAVSSQRQDYLTGVERAVEQRFRSGEMSSDEHDQFLTIIKTARSGDWPAADRDALMFEKAQLNRSR